MVMALLASSGPDRRRSIRVLICPGCRAAATLQTLINGLGAWALIAALAGLVIGAAAWALGVHSQNFQQSMVGRRAVLVSGLAGPAHRGGAAHRQLLLHTPAHTVN